MYAFESDAFASPNEASILAGAAEPYVAGSVRRAMVFVRDEGSVFDAPLDEVWTFVGSRDHHSAAHAHRRTERRALAEHVGQYSWEQEFDGGAVRFSMRWTAFAPLGVAYEVLEGPFAGSKFFLYYEPIGARTRVAVVGEFVSPTLPAGEIEPAVRRFFEREFEQDHAAIRRDLGRAGPNP